MFLRRWSNRVTRTKSGRLEVNLSLSGKRGGKSHLGAILLSAVSEIWRFCMVIRRCCLYLWGQCTHDPKEPVLLIALRIMRHAMLCLSVIIFLICVCWHPERMCRALSTCGQIVQFVWHAVVSWLRVECLAHYAGCANFFGTKLIDGWQRSVSNLRGTIKRDP